jgi:hypothetical protein
MIPVPPIWSFTYMLLLGAVSFAFRSTNRRPGIALRIDARV